MSFIIRIDSMFWSSLMRKRSAVNNIKNIIWIMLRIFYKHGDLFSLNVSVQYDQFSFALSLSDCSHREKKVWATTLHDETFWISSREYTTSSFVKNYSPLNVSHMFLEDSWNSGKKSAKWKTKNSFTSRADSNYN